MDKAEGHDPEPEDGTAAPPPKRKRREEKPSDLNNLDMRRWKEYEDVLTDSLWLIPERDRSGAHMGDYHGNFVPQIPNQALRRFTKQGDVVLDAFLGSGTTLIECRRLGRHGIGVELKKDLAARSAERIAAEENPFGMETRVVAGDSANAKATQPIIREALAGLGREQAQMLMLHPPYHSIIKFSGRKQDLSNCADVDAFTAAFGRVVDTYHPFLESGKFLVLVIGDMYAQGEWVPLGFYCMQEVMRRGYTLKSIVVKDMKGNRAKRNMENIWRYRALKGNFYIFKHEYVMFFQKATG